MPYEWLAGAMERLAGVEPHEVLQVLGARWRRPVPAAGPMRLLTVWGRTRAGRPLIVVLRHEADLDYLIVAARQMTDTEAAEHARWERLQEEEQ
ncbi:hypothetical protein [Stackebrandtia albiflava]|uniref:hypothetical protein n=1 Tax=Stackebrandtia albiflava TaxID=406432 RepID=UPI0011BFD7B2|nr:hypothetical protein [Stackebrandtia albiflava]